MAEIEINGGVVVYEFVGPEDGQVVVLTPGGRFSKDYGGVHPLAEGLADGGKRVLLWDRPNCGASDIQFYGPLRIAHARRDHRAMVEKLGIEPVVAARRLGWRPRHRSLFTIMYPDWSASSASGRSSAAPSARMTWPASMSSSELRTVRSQGIEGVIDCGCRRGRG